tara:strand:- start:858 stop:1385 length:528 start_codon:yes stop_codon:yes gene_type:complete
MSTIVTRAGKGSPLTNNELDANFNNLNTDKLETGSLSVTTTAAGTAGLAYASNVFTYTPPNLSGYATAAQGTLADSALQTGDKVAVGIASVVTSSSLTATVNTHVYVSAATQTITLPASPTIGQRVLVTVGNFIDTVVGRNSSNIMSSGTDMTLDKAYLSIQFIYTDATQGWVMS